MTLPHQCRCAICGEIGTITPGLPNVFADLLSGSAPKTIMGNVPETPYASSRADELAPRNPPSGGDVILTGGKPGNVGGNVILTCTHGYTVCRVCKFPPVPI